MAFKRGGVRWGGGGGKLGHDAAVNESSISVQLAMVVGMVQDVVAMVVVCMSPAYMMFLAAIAGGGGGCCRGTEGKKQRQR